MTCWPSLGFTTYTPGALHDIFDTFDLISLSLDQISARGATWHLTLTYIYVLDLNIDIWPSTGGIPPLRSTIQWEWPAQPRINKGQNKASKTLGLLKRTLHAAHRKWDKRHTRYSCDQRSSLPHAPGQLTQRQAFRQQSAYKRSTAQLVTS